MGIMDCVQVCDILVKICCTFDMSIMAEYDTFYKQASLFLSTQQDQY